MEPQVPKKVLISLFPDDIDRLERLAALVVEPGARPNQSFAVRQALRLLEKNLKKNPRKAID